MGNDGLYTLTVSYAHCCLVYSGSKKGLESFHGTMARCLGTSCRSGSQSLGVGRVCLLWARDAHHKDTGTHEKVHAMAHSPAAGGRAVRAAASLFLSSSSASELTYVQYPYYPCYLLLLLLPLLPLLPQREAQHVSCMYSVCIVLVLCMVLMYNFCEHVLGHGSSFF